MLSNWFNSESRQTVPQVFESHYRAHARLKPLSERRYRCELSRWERFCGAVAIRNLVPETFAAFRNAGLAAGLKPESIESTIKVVKAIVRFCRDRGWISALPIWGKPLPGDFPEPNPATLAEIEAVYLQARHATLMGRGGVSPHAAMQAWLAIGLWTGLRLSDLSQRLSWSHVRWDQGCIRFKASKTSRPHVFPISTPVERHLKLLEPNGHESLFGVRTVYRIDVELGRLCEAAGVRRLTAQNIRQASVTQWDALGVGPLVHGCGLPKVMNHYLGVLQRLNQVADRFPWPAAMLRTDDRQMRLFG